MKDFRLEPVDELPHQPDAAPTFNESFYVNGWDPQARLGGWMRVGNRVHEGHAEISLCLYLPRGRLAVQFARPEISSNDAFSAAGLTLTVDTPFQQARARYQGEVMLLDNPEMLRDPKAMYAQAPRVACSLDWLLTTVSPVHGGEPTRAEQQTMYGREFSRGHFNQHTRVTGPLRVGAESWTLNGHGWRDHSWGPRTWQAIHHYRLFIGNFDEGSGFMLLKITDHQGQTRRTGVWMADGEYEELEDLDVLVDWTGKKEPRSVRLGVRTAKRRTILEGQVLTLAPLRNRRELDGKTVTSRIAEGFTEFTWEGRKGLGICEFIEVLEDGEPAGYPL